MGSKENLSHLSMWCICLETCYAASSNLQGILHALKISGCMMHSAVTNGLICCTCAAWIWSAFLYVVLNLWKLVSLSIYKIIEEIDFHISTIGLHILFFQIDFFLYLRCTCKLGWNWWINFYLLPESSIQEFSCTISLQFKFKFSIKVFNQFGAFW